ARAMTGMQPNSFAGALAGLQIAKLWTQTFFAHKPLKELTSVFQTRERMHRHHLPLLFLYDQSRIAIPVFIDVKTERRLKTFQASVIGGPKTFDLDTFEQKSHQLGTRRLE